jgi:Ca2+-binding RTX toxin-like protein
MSSSDPDSWLPALWALRPVGNKEGAFLKTRRSLSACIAAALVAGSLVLLAPAAHAKTPKCFGKKATIVGTNGDDNDFDTTDGTGSGLSVIQGTKKADVIVGKGGDDIIVGFGGNDLICGGKGDDRIIGLGGSDKMDGGGSAKNPGSDQIDFGFAKRGVTANLATETATGEGNDVIRHFETVAGSNFDDNLTGDSGVNIMDGATGDDVLTGGPTSQNGDQDSIDIIDPGDGNDQVFGGDGFDLVSYLSKALNEDGTTPPGVTVDLSAGTATGLGDDGLDGIEAVLGSEFNDVIKGDAGFNLFLPGGGDDQVTGGGGDDYVIFWFAPGDITASLESGTATGEGNDTLANDLEGLFGSIAGNDNLTGNNKNNFIAGDAGNDIINGGQGDDWLSGGAGNDTIDGGQGNYDLVDFSTSLAAVTANLATNTASGEGTDSISNLEAIFGSSFNDNLTGDTSANYLFGWFGSDSINGGTGNDEIDGDEDADGADTDSADGGGGNDTCANAETLLQCTAVEAQDIRQHPLNSQAQEVAAFRRNL